MAKILVNVPNEMYQEIQLLKKTKFVNISALIRDSLSKGIEKLKNSK